jgi:GNAT superfamily N-acetyltransferase
METDYRYIRYGQLADLGACHPAVQELGPENEHFPSCFTWLRRCPDVYADFPCYFYLRSGDRIVASVAAFPDTLVAEGRKLPWAWGGSILTSPQSRGKGFGRDLWRAATQTVNEHGLTMGGAFVNPIMTHISEGLGFTIVERVPRLVLLKSARPFLSHHLPAGWLVAAFDAPYRVASAGLRRLALRGVRGQPDVRLEELGDLDHLEEMQGHATPHYNSVYHFSDAADKFCWKVAQCTNSQVYLVRDACSSNMLARFVVKTRDVTKPFADKYTGFRLMTLMDYVFFGQPEGSYRAIADAVVRLFWESKAEVLETVSSCPALNSQMRKKFLVPVGKGVAFFFKGPSGVDVPSDATAIRNWHFTHFSSDAFSFW